VQELFAHPMGRLISDILVTKREKSATTSQNTSSKWGDSAFWKKIASRWR
jgi:hypothetical protein